MRNRLRREFASNPVSLLGAVIVFTFVAAALTAPFLPIASPTDQIFDLYLAPTLDHPLGTDHLGRDVLSGVVWGTRVSLMFGVIVALISASVGLVLGAVSGYFGGVLDAFLMRLTDVALSLPLILVAIVLVAAIGTSFANVVLVIVLLLWPRYARQIRGETLALRERDFVALARIANCSHFRIIRRHILPNVVPTLLVLVTLQSGYVVLLESTLSFLGAGIPPSTPAWGLMISEGRTVIESAWWVVVWPGLAIVALVLSGNLLGDWLRDRLDPTLNRMP